MCVLKSKEVSKLAGGYAAERGRVFVHARVRYVAEAAYDYNYLDWMAHDDKGTQNEAYAYGYFGAGGLQVGTLAAGRSSRTGSPTKFPWARSCLARLHGPWRDSHLLSAAVLADDAGSELGISGSPGVRR